MKDEGSVKGLLASLAGNDSLTDEEAKACGDGWKRGNIGNAFLQVPFARSVAGL